MLRPSDLPRELGEDGFPRLLLRSDDGRKVVSVVLRCPDDSMDDEQLLARAAEYGWPKTCTCRLGSGRLELWYWTAKKLSFDHLEFEDGCSLDAFASKSLAPGACINGNADYVQLSQDPIAELPALATARWDADQRALARIEAECHA